MFRHLLSRLKARIAATARAPGLADAPDIDAQIDARIDAMLRLATDQGHPNINPLWRALKDIESLRLNVKLLGYELAAAYEPRLQALPIERPGPFIADSKPATQDDFETRWFRYWCEQLRERPRYHRMLWTFAYTLQALHAAKAVTQGARVLFLGDTPHPIPSYLAAKGVDVVVVQTPDRPIPEPANDPLWDLDFVEAEAFARHVSRRTMERGELPGGLTGFDACWSFSAAAVQGSIRAGMDSVLRAMATLKPGGLAVHMIEFNYADDEQTLDNWSTVLFQKRHIEQLAAELTAAGHEVAPLDFSVGYRALDRFVDIPPFGTDRTIAFDRLWRDGWQSAHLRVSVDGFAVATFGLIVRARG